MRVLIWRRHVRRWVAAATAVGGLVLLGGGTAEADAIVSLPTRIGAPTPWTADLQRSPIGSASIAFSGSQWWWSDSLAAGDQVTLVGARSDTYRLLSTYIGAAGLSGVLSGDGRWLADAQGWVDLKSGRRTKYPAAILSAETIGVPQAWAPDNRHLVVALHRQSGGWNSQTWTPEPSMDGLEILDIQTRQVQQVPSFVAGRWLPGWAVAYSRDGTRMAYQTDETVHIVPIAGGGASVIRLAANTYLAGKGAWTPDGRGLMVVTGERCTCAARYPVRWTLSTISVATGRAIGQSRVFDGAYAVRVLGQWGSVGVAVVRYEPEPGTAVTLLESDDAREELIGLDDVETVRVVAVDSSGATQTLLNAAPDGAESIDIADGVLARGVTRPGDPPLLTAHFLIYSVPMTVLIVVVILLTILFVWRRKRRAVRRLTP